MMQKIIRTKVGPLRIVVSEQGLHGIFWVSNPDIETCTGSASITSQKILDEAETQIQQYFEGSRKSFHLPFDLKGSSFQKKVWAALLEIPYGQTISYKSLAARIHSPKACRAVGNANSKNPISIMVPCHRVIAENGSIGGYAGGVDTKRKLLEHESSLIL